MKKIDQHRLNLGDFLIAKRLEKSTRLGEINDTIKWDPIRCLLEKELGYKTDAVGNPSYPPLAMFKILLLQRLYDLSDVQIEEALLDRISFIKFVGLSVETSVPDATTICRFRKALRKAGLHQKLFDAILEQLKEQNLELKHGINVDATVVESARHPRKTVDLIPLDRSEPDTIDGQTDTSEATSDAANIKMEVKYSDDPDATWIVKAGKAQYGYKIHMASSADKGFILGGHVTTAARSDMNELPQLLQEIPQVPNIPINADKGYTSEKNRQAIKKAGFIDHIMDKATRNHPLTIQQQQRNREISKVRSRIERLFGHMKRNLGFARSRYVGLDKIKQEFFLVAIATNLVTATAKVSKFLIPS